MDLVVATKNKKKLKEIKQIWKGLGLKVTSLADHVSTPRIIENGKTFKENAVKKHFSFLPCYQNQEILLLIVVF